MKAYPQMIGIGLGAVILSFVAFSDIEIDVPFGKAEAASNTPDVELIEAQIIRGDAVTQVVILEDGRSFELVQVFPTVNKEHVCLIALDPQGAPILNGRERINDLDCFPIKMNPTPTMY